MNLLLVDDKKIREQLLPLTFTRPVAALRIGIDTIVEKWQAALPEMHVAAVSCEDYLAALWPAPEGDSVMVPGHLLPDEELVAAVRLLRPGETLEPHGERTAVTTLPSLFMQNAATIEADFARITAGRKSAPTGEGTMVIGDRSRLFIEPGATVTAAIINVTTGPVYVGRGAEIAEGSCVRGPVALLNDAHINMATRVWPGTTIGPFCKVGGELNNVIFLGYSNKAHDGFLGNAVIGEWCNLGADTVASNLKNDYSEVRLWSYASRRFEKTGLQFCGLMMGDHSRAGINTMFNTATVVGVGCNIYGPGFPRTFIPSFSIGGADGFSRMLLPKLIESARRMMARRHVELTPAMERVFEHLYNLGD